MGLRKTFLAIGIAIIFALFIGYGLYVFYEMPKGSYGQDCYEEFKCYDLSNCTKEVVVEDRMENEEQTMPVPVEADPFCHEKLYDSKEYQECEEKRDECRENALLVSPQYAHARFNFFALLIFAAIALIVGVYLKNLEGIGSGFIGGGILLILWSLPYTNLYWFNWNKYIKLAALGLILVLLIYLGYKKLEK
ncbi:hypothetical protein HOC35_01285 [Candidatus Woesearchaeota archaeon]|jgi:hypothetical protein|nr:hypothetical protein [Candidatus Woesearchaeota archaeon]